MRVQTDCYACILSQSVRLAKLASPDPEEQSRLIRRMLQKVLEADDRATPPEFAGQFNEIVSEVSGIDDPFREVKDQSTRLGLELLPEHSPIPSRRKSAWRSAGTSSTTG